MNKAAKELSNSLNLTQRRLKALTALFGVDPDEMTIGTFIKMIELMRWDRSALEMFVEQEFSYSVAESLVKAPD